MGGGGGGGLIEGWDRAFLLGYHKGINMWKSEGRGEGQSEVTGTDQGIICCSVSLTLESK